MNSALTRDRSDWRVSDSQHQVLLSVLPQYGLELKLETASSFAASRTARPQYAAARSRSQAKKCQLARSPMPWRSSHLWGCSRWEHAIPRGPPPARRSTRQQATAASSVCLRYSGRRRAACCTGETLSRRWDMSCVAAHSCGWMRQVGLRRKEKRHTRGGCCWYGPVHGRGGH